MKDFSIVVPIIDDDSVEGMETFTAKLTSSQEQLLLVNSSVDVTILDDDTVRMRLDQLEYSVFEEDRVAVLSVRKEGKNDIPIRVVVSTADGSAVGKPQS